LSIKLPDKLEYERSAMPVPVSVNPAIAYAGKRQRSLSTTSVIYAEDVMYWDEWPMHHPFLLFVGKAFNKPDYFGLWKTLDLYPENQKEIRNLPLRNTFLRILNEPVL